MTATKNASLTTTSAKPMTKQRMPLPLPKRFHSLFLLLHLLQKFCVKQARSCLNARYAAKKPTCAAQAARRFFIALATAHHNTRVCIKMNV